MSIKLKPLPYLWPMLRVSFLLIVILGALAPVRVFAQFGPSSPVANMDGVEIRKMADIPGGFYNRHPIRIAQNPSDGALYVLATSAPDGRDVPATSVIYRLDPAADGTFELVSVLTDDDHGTPRPVGMAFGPDGVLYLVGNDEVGSTETQIVIRRGTPSGGGWDWATVAISEPYLLSYTYFDHRANSVVVSPDGSTLFVNSGSRSDHGEMYGGVREEGLTAIILQIPADATDLVLPNDRQALKDADYIYAEGIRNTADLAFAPNGDLFGPDNAGDRDDPGELNWLRKGEHYGFPWRIGGNDTPMQFDGYDPTTDPLVPSPCNPNNADTGCYFSNDPDYPPPPEGVTFVEPIPNAGPYADKFLDPETGAIRDASEEGTTITTFEGGRSPLGLVFDADSLLVGRLKGGAFILSFAGARGGFPEEGQDLIFLDLEKGTDGYTLSAEAVVTGFTHPIDAVMVDDVVYVVEYGDWFSAGGSRGVWAVTFPEDPETSSAPQIEVPTVHLDAYPNPTAGALTLVFRLPAPSDVQIELVDVLGRVVRTINRRAGTSQVVVSTEGLGAGIYVARLTAGTTRASRTITVVR